MAKVLDRSKDFGEIVGGSGRERFEQGGCYFDTEGKEIVASKEEKAAEKARLAEEARLAKEAEDLAVIERLAEEERLMEVERLAAAEAANSSQVGSTAGQEIQPSLLDDQLAAQAGVTE